MRKTLEKDDIGFVIGKQSQFYGQKIIQIISKADAQNFLMTGLMMHRLTHSDKRNRLMNLLKMPSKQICQHSQTRVAIQQVNIMLKLT